MLCNFMANIKNQIYFPILSSGVPNNGKISLSLTLMSCHFFSLPQDGATPLFIASQNGHSDVVTILLRNGAGVDVAKNVSYLMISV